MASKTEKRGKEILRLLLSRGKTSVEELTDQLATSPASIRRDLARLEEQGLVHRTHGGAMLAGNTYEPFRFDADFQVRSERFAPEKQRIAQAAVDLVRDDETIGFTAGTTTTQVARLLRLRSGLRIITNAVNIGMELSANTTLDTYLTGGCIRWPGAFSLVGPAAIESLNLLVVDKLFLGVTGIQLDYGVTVIQPDEAAVCRAMSRRAKQVIVVADSSKVGMVSPAVICPVREIHTLVTDDGISDKASRAFEDSGVHVIAV
ncbi:MAG TPA: DeoR/GlpR family DNA-binding transcription regulator [Acidobacteriaceae bacterium]|jgi:DeoR family transcriptional regulator of aga operon